jgi:hypothetical protein
MACERVTPFISAHRSTCVVTFAGSRNPIIGVTPVAGLPRLFCFADTDFFMLF